MSISNSTEVLVKAFIVLCVFLIIFEIIQAFKMRNRDKKIKELTKDNKIIIEFLREPDLLKKEVNLISFEICLDNEEKSDPKNYKRHLELTNVVFRDLITKSKIKDKIVKSYIVYLATKYKLFYQTLNTSIKRELIYMVGDENVYIRENALKCIYSIGDKKLVFDALEMLDNSGIEHNRKLLHDGLLTYAGNLQDLCDYLLPKFESFSLSMQIMLATFFRFATANNTEHTLGYLKDNTKNRELRLSALRYFTKYPYEPAYPYICELAQDTSDFWEYRVVAATCLGSYPKDSTIELLKKMTSDPEWYVRKNAIDSLIRLKVDDNVINDILSSDDRYAKEAMQYILDKEKLLSEDKKTCN